MRARLKRWPALFLSLALACALDVAQGAPGSNATAGNASAAPANATAAAAAAAGAPSLPACLAKLSDAASQCSGCLNRANNVAYTRLDRVFGMRGNSAFRLDLTRFFHLAVTFSQDEVKPPEACCKAAAEVFSSAFQDGCACSPAVVEHTKWFDKELVDYYYDFLTSSCALEGPKVAPWRSCGFNPNTSFVIRAQETAFKIPDWVDQIVGAGKGIAKAATTAATGAVTAAAGAASGAASTAAGAAGAAAGALTGVASNAVGALGGVVGGVGGLVGGVGGALGGVGGALGGAGGALRGVPLIGKRRRMQEGQCSAAGAATRVANNNASVAFYYLCPAATGHCNAGKCVFGRTAAVGKGQWATCVPLKGCDDDGGGGASGGGSGGAAAAGGSGCFPGGAAVQLPGGASKRMGDLRVGDKVLAARPDGSLVYEDVYFFGHRDANVEAEFVRLELSGGAVLELTPDHFVPLAARGGAAGANALAGARYAYARDVAVGDSLLVAARGGGGGLEVAAVVSTSAVTRAGLFNPYTLGGKIVVDGVLASAHSSWLVDRAAAALGASHLLPDAFQALFAPLRALYAAAGPEATQRFGDALARAALRLDAAAAGAGGGAAGAPAVAAAAAALGAAGAVAVLKRARAL